MGELIQVQLGEHRAIYSFDMNDIDCDRDHYVIVEVDRGSEFGKVVSYKGQACKGKVESAQGKLLRKATDGDLKQIANNRMKALDAQNICLRKVNERKLEMQLVKTEYTFDSSKIIFFFTAEGRVDFRALVKDLARVFRVRIELKQIGVRDRAKVVGGYGVCGRELCCTSYMKDFHQLSIRMTKDQGLPLNPSRISGVCGRIKCCMAYEFNAYRDLAKNLPRVGDKVTVPEGKGKVIDLNILKRIALIELAEGQIIRKEFPKSATVVIEREGKEENNNEELKDELKDILDEG